MVVVFNNNGICACMVVVFNNNGICACMIVVFNINGICACMIVVFNINGICACMSVVFNNNGICACIIYMGARCSSVVRAFAHGAMGPRIDPSWAISRSSQCSTIGIAKAVVCVILSVGWCI